MPTVIAVFAASLVAAPAAQADDRTVVTVVGTSDVYDSNLVQSVIEPGFEAAYPQYDLQYVSKGTGAAIAYAEAGTADALIVHAASLENQFVDSGYSAEPYGRAIFWGDYILAGPADDPAGVLTGAGSHDIVTAFEKVAAAGAAGDATFVSRGGTPGTTVQEHAIWQLADPSLVSTCAVSDANGGGVSPSTTSGACANPIALPSWYKATGQTQAPNITTANTCNFPNGGCYVFTDRGTFNYLQSTNAVDNLKIVTRDNDETARGTTTALVNSFHAYAIDPAKFPSADFPNVHINTAGATAFLNWITSKAGQSAVGDYLKSAGTPFIPSAAPTLTGSTLPDLVNSGKPITITGKLANVTPGTPALNGVTVSLKGVPTATPEADPVTLDTTTTSATGTYSFTYTPTASQKYSVSVADITKIENATLTPVFGDILQGTSTALGTVDVVTPPQSKVSISKIAVSKTYVGTVTVKLSPTASGTGNIVRLYGNNNSKTPVTKLLKSVAVPSGASSVTITYTLSTKKHAWKTLTWKLKATYSGPHILGSVSTVKAVKLS